MPRHLCNPNGNFFKKIVFHPLGPLIPSFPLLSSSLLFSLISPLSSLSFSIVFFFLLLVLLSSDLLIFSSVFCLVFSSLCFSLFSSFPSSRLSPLMNIHTVRNGGTPVRNAGRTVRKGGERWQTVANESNLTKIQLRQKPKEE